MGLDELDRRLDQIAGVGWAKVSCKMKSGTKWVARIDWVDENEIHRGVSARGCSSAEALVNAVRMYDGVCTPR